MTSPCAQHVPCAVRAHTSPSFPVRLSVFCSFPPLCHLCVSVISVRAVRSQASSDRYDPKCVLLQFTVCVSACSVVPVWTVSQWACAWWGPEPSQWPGATGGLEHAGTGEAGGLPPAPRPPLLQTLVPEVRGWLLALTAAWGFLREQPLGWGPGGRSWSEWSSLGPYGAERSCPAWPPRPYHVHMGTHQGLGGSAFLIIFFSFLPLGLNLNTVLTFSLRCCIFFHLFSLHIPNAFLIMFYSKEDEAFSQEHLKNTRDPEF